MIDYDEDLLFDLKRVYGDKLGDFLSSLSKPPDRFYVRVNTLKSTPEKVKELLENDGVEVYFDEVFEETLWIPVRGPVDLEEPICKVFVDKRTAESVMLGANVYAPGIIRLEKCVDEGRRVGVVSNNGVLVAIGIVSPGYREAIRSRRGLVVKILESLYRVPSLRDTRAYRAGMIYEQSLPSMVVAHVLRPRGGAVVVDMCAAPGGKIGHVYELVKGEGVFIAIDHSSRKINKMNQEFVRLGYTSINIIKGDSRYVDLFLGKEYADYVILDPPCSSIGVIPKIYDRKTIDEVRNYANYQKQFLKSAYNLLKPGGILVYSTCTTTYLENEANIEYAVNVIGYEVLEASPMRGCRGVGYLGRYLQRFHPHIHKVPGYFIAKLQKPAKN